MGIGYAGPFDIGVEPLEVGMNHIGEVNEMVCVDAREIFTVEQILAKALGGYVVLDTEVFALEELDQLAQKVADALTEERAKVEALRALARSQHIKLNDLEEYFKEACGYHAAIVGCFETATAQCDFDKSVFNDLMRRYKKLFDTRQAVYLENSGCVEQAEARARELGAL